MCAIAGVVGCNPELHGAGVVYESLFAQQHRGTDASGITSSGADFQLETHRGEGMVIDVYGDEDMMRLTGNLAIGQNRYPTSGNKKGHTQPFEDPAIGLAVSHNGNFPDTERLELFLEKSNIDTSRFNDSEMAGLIIAQHIRMGQDLPTAVISSYPHFEGGAFSCVALHHGQMVAFRDDKGIRPLALGEFDDGFAAVSETCGLDIIGAAHTAEVRPGQMAVINEQGVEFYQVAEGEDKLDMFELVYFARHDSRLYGESVNEVRRRFGEELADQHGGNALRGKNSIVFPVPDTSVPAAEGFAEMMGLPHRQAIIKNRYIGRTFMQPTHADRQAQLKRKHSMIPEQVKGRDIILIDDSIVRLNTMPNLVLQAKVLGAKSVSVLVASPPVRFPDYYGIDTPHQSELAAANMTIEEMRARIDCDYLGFLSLERMVRATRHPASKFNLSQFNGDYPIDIGRRRQEVNETPVGLNGPLQAAARSRVSIGARRG